MTPYPNDDDAYEIPSIVRSLDGIEWAVPDGLTNPILEALPSTKTYSDSDLSFVDDTFYYVFRESPSDDAPHGTGETIWVMTSTDGVEWGEPASMLTSDARASMLSPALVYENGAWRMWLVNATASPNVLEMRTADAITGPWSAAQTCDPQVPAGKDVWHIDVVLQSGGYAAAINYCNANVSGPAGFLRFGASEDGLEWAVSETGIDPAGSIERVYRGSLIHEGETWKLWYSDRTTEGSWGINFVTTDLVPTIEVPPVTPPSLRGSFSAWPSMRP